MPRVPQLRRLRPRGMDEEHYQAIPGNSKRSAEVINTILPDARELIPANMLNGSARLYLPQNGGLVEILGARRGYVADLFPLPESVFDGLPVTLFNSATQLEVTLPAADVVQPCTLFAVGYTNDGGVNQTFCELKSTDGYFLSTGLSYQYRQCMRYNMASSATAGLGSGNPPQGEMMAQAASCFYDGSVFWTSLASWTRGFAETVKTGGGSSPYTATVTSPTLRIGAESGTRYLDGGLAMVGCVPGKAWNFGELEWFARNMTERLRRYYQNLP